MAWRKRDRRGNWGGTGLGLLGVLALSVPASADVALTATLQTGTTPQTQTAQTQAAQTQAAQTQTAQTQGTGLTTQAVRLWLQGSNARLEVAGEPVLLYTGKTQLVNGLDPAHKTYYMTVLTDTEDADLVPSGPGVTENVKLDLSPDKTASPQTQTLAGQNAHPYTLSGTITFTRARPAGGRGGGRHRRGGGGGGGFPGGGGGGFPLLTGLAGTSTTVDQYGGPPDGTAPNGSQNGGGYGGNGGGNPGERLPQWTISGDVWLADDVSYPAKENTSVAASLIAASAGPFAAPLADALAKHKGLPLQARIAVLCVPPSAGGRPVNQYGGVSEGAPPPRPISTVTTWTVQSLVVAPLSSTLFQAPADYALVAAPQTPYLPGS